MDSEPCEENKNLPEIVKNEKCVFISGIPYDATEEKLREIFEPCGIIKNFKLPKYQDTGRNIGYAHIYFKKNKGVHKVYIFLS